jgi:hypothetical protein
MNSKRFSNASQLLGIPYYFSMTYGTMEYHWRTLSLSYFCLLSSRGSHFTWLFFIANLTYMRFSISLFPCLVSMHVQRTSLQKIHISNGVTIVCMCVTWLGNIKLESENLIQCIRTWYISSSKIKLYSLCPKM